MEQPLRCCLCSRPILPDRFGWDRGHNPEPLAVGRCCSQCNDTLVIPVRLKRMFSAVKKKPADIED